MTLLTEIEHTLSITSGNLVVLFRIVLRKFRLPRLYQHHQHPHHRHRRIQRGGSGGDG